MSAHQPQAAAGASSSAAPAAVHQLILQAELHAASVAEALTHYESALERLNQHIRSLPSGSAAQSQQIQRFGELLSTAELLKQQQQTNPSAAEYSWRQRQATRIAVEVRFVGARQQPAWLVTRVLLGSSLWETAVGMLFRSHCRWQGVALSSCSGGWVSCVSACHASILLKR